MAHWPIRATVNKPAPQQSHLEDRETQKTQAQWPAWITQGTWQNRTGRGPMGSPGSAADKGPPVQTRPKRNRDPHAKPAKTGCPHHQQTKRRESKSKSICTHALITPQGSRSNTFCKRCKFITYRHMLKPGVEWSHRVEWFLEWYFGVEFWSVFVFEVEFGVVLWSQNPEDTGDLLGTR